MKEQKSGKQGMTPPVKIRRPGEAATLADVGREAGVSQMAVSVVLNGAKTSARISAETRARVLAAAERLRYRPNMTARALTHRRMNTIGVVTHLLGDEPNLYFLEVFSGIMRAATAAGQSSTTFALDGWHEAAQRIPSFCDGRIDGLIVLAPELSDDASSWLPDHTPVVSVHANQPLAGVVNIESDEEGGAFAIVQQMLQLGHRRILHLAGPSETLGAQRRLVGYLRAYAAARLKPPAGHVVHCEFDAEAGRSALEGWLGQHIGQRMPDAVFGANDAIALGCVELLQERGVRVPVDVSVVGFDNTLMARAVRLATVRQPLRELGQRAVQILLDCIEARRKDGVYDGERNIVLPVDVVPGTSLAAPRSTELLVV
jgi:LacI family transcriptional regulator